MGNIYERCSSPLSNSGAPVAHTHIGKKRKPMRKPIMVIMPSSIARGRLRTAAAPISLS